MISPYFTYVFHANWIWRIRVMMSPYSISLFDANWIWGIGVMMSPYFPYVFDVNWIWGIACCGKHWKGSSSEALWLFYCVCLYHTWSVDCWIGGSIDWFLHWSTKSTQWSINVYSQPDIFFLFYQLFIVVNIHACNTNQTFPVIRHFQ